ncbi:MAG: hypothetical protein V1753_12630 [Pseudomonadota bacterium]
MPNYHILRQDKEQNTVDCVFHIPIPATLNVVGISYQIAWRDSLGGATNIKSVLPNITPAELTAMQAGQIGEKPFTVRFSSVSLNDAQRLNQVLAAYTAVKAQEITEKQITLAFWGKEGDV